MSRVRSKFRSFCDDFLRLCHAPRHLQSDHDLPTERQSDCRTDLSNQHHEQSTSLLLNDEKEEERNTIILTAKARNGCTSASNKRPNNANELHPHIYFND